MKSLALILSLASAALLALPAHAADKAPTAQQTKMKTCNAEAKGMKGDERKAFMKQCLSAKPAAAAPASGASGAQQDKMKSCNAEAKGKKGAERKAFMKECLSKG